MIPIKCFTCGRMLADRYRLYTHIVQQQKNELAEREPARVKYFTSDFVGEKSIEGKVMDEMGFHNACCRRHVMTNVDID
jgi:DNA-directed RNA polymerase subunit N (RpoN/RPB10)